MPQPAEVLPTNRLIDAAGVPVADPWTLVADDAPLPAQGPAIVGLARVGEAAAAGIAPLGVVVPGDTRVEVLLPLLPNLGLVAVRFPKFRDGRGFTLARTLREHHGFRGELRALGDVLPDQYVMLLECGFTRVEIRADQVPERWAAMLPGPAAAPLKPRAAQLFHRVSGFPTQPGQ